MRVNIYKTILDEDKKPSLIKDWAINYDIDEDGLRNPKDVAALINHLFDAKRLAEEYLWIIGVNIKLKPIGIFEAFHGSTDFAPVSTREIFTRLCLLGASGFFIIHNHPSSDLSPSEHDISTTETLKKCGELLSIPLLDHIIVSDGYFSFGAHGLLDMKGEPK